MCSDCASVPMRGSRFTGMDSIRKLTVFESPAERLDEHPAKNTKMQNAAEANWVHCLPRAGIADFSENSGIARAGRTGKIVRGLVPCFVGKHGECKRFFGVGGNS